MPCAGKDMAGWVLGVVQASVGLLEAVVDR